MLPSLVCLVFCVLQVSAVMRQYYITAEELDWDYAPLAWDHLRDLPLDGTPVADLYTSKNATRLGTVYRKAIFRQYTDASFSVPVTHDPYLGFLGPVIRAEVGDRIQIDFVNRGSQPYSLHPHTHDDNDATRLLPGHAIGPGEGFHYVWDVPSHTTFPANQSSVLWVYLSKANRGDLHAGLLGPIVVYQQGALKKSTPDSMFALLDGGKVQEVFTLMMTSDENESSLLPQTAARQGMTPDTLDQLRANDDFQESNRMYHINGYIYNNNADLRIYYGKPVRWYVLAFGIDDEDVHTAHWHGATLLHQGHRVDVIELTPTSLEVLDMIPDNEGQWLFHCHVASHFDAGMTAFYQVEKLEYTGEEGWE